jgi:hypothetical protein
MMFVSFFFWCFWKSMCVSFGVHVSILSFRRVSMSELEFF